MAYTHLTIQERRQIYFRIRRGESLRSIGRLLGRHHSTISREFKRNRPFNYPACEDTHEQALKRRCTPRHQCKRHNKKLYDYVVARLQEGWSPDVISGRLKIAFPNTSSMRVSHEGIYQWVFKDFQQGGTLFKCLPRGHRRRRKQRKYGSLRGLIKNRVSIHERPSVVERRRRLGDWEGDLVEGKKGSGYIVTHVDRKSKFLMASMIPNKRAESFNQATINLFKIIKPYYRKTLTLDNGKEFTSFKIIELNTNLSIFFADPYCSWQRGTNEQTNGLLRRYVPKGTDLKLLQPRQLQQFVNIINHRPRKSLHYRTPYEVFKRALVAHF